jgi:hypothetical protein
VKLHPRHRIVEDARLKIEEAINDVYESHQLTMLEVVGILQNAAAQAQLYALRQERHPCCGGRADAVCACSACTCGVKVTS